MNLNFNDINWIGVLIVTVLSFVLGAFWHSVLFNKAWTKDSGTIYNKNNHGNPLNIFGLSAVLHIIAIIGLSLVIGKDASAMDGLLKGLFVSLVWISTSIGVTYIFVGRSLRLFLIDAGFYVAFLSLAGLILGSMQ